MSRRDQIKMTEAEIETFLEESRTMSVATIGRDGRPHLVAMWYTIIDGAPAFWTFAKSQKIVNLRRDPRITCMVEAGDLYSDLRGVEIIGGVEMTEDEDELLKFGVAQWERYQGVKISEEALPAVKRMSAKRVLVKVIAERIVSWDHRKLGGAY